VGSLLLEGVSELAASTAASTHGFGPAPGEKGQHQRYDEYGIHHVSVSEGS
jgi:hypothetical protein